MNDLELEPLPTDVLDALQPLAAPPPALPPGVAEAVLLKVKAAAGLAAVVTGAASVGGAGTSAGSSTAGAMSSGATSAGTSSGAGATSSGATSAGTSTTGASGGAATTGSSTAGAATSAATNVGVAVAKGGASLLLKVLPAVTLTAGIGLGVAADRLVLRPNSVQERVVVRRVEVPVLPATPTPAPTTPPRVAPAPGLPKKPLAVDSLGKERIVLDLARSALAAKDWAQALAAVSSHEAQFPTGQLVEERETLAIQALVGAGRRDEAKRRVASFVARFADSPVRASLEAMVRD